MADDDEFIEPELPDDDEDERPIEIRLRRFATAYCQSLDRVRASGKTFSGEQLAGHISKLLQDMLRCADGLDFVLSTSGPLRFRVAYGHDLASGAWTAVIDRSQGVSCVTQGSTKDEARTRIRQALAVYLDDEQEAASAELLED